jgi:hypothetical protein
LIVYVIGLIALTGVTRLAWVWMQALAKRTSIRYIDKMIEIVVIDKFLVRAGLDSPVERRRRGMIRKIRHSFLVVADTRNGHYKVRLYLGSDHKGIIGDLLARAGWFYFVWSIKNRIRKLRKNFPVRLYLYWMNDRFGHRYGHLGLTKKFISVGHKEATVNIGIVQVRFVVKEKWIIDPVILSIGIKVRRPVMPWQKVYVNMYCTTSHYGGLEEGGWWYNAHRFVKSLGVFNVKHLKQAEQLQEKFNKKGLKDGVHRMGSGSWDGANEAGESDDSWLITGGAWGEGDLVAWIEPGIGQDSDDYEPYS